MKKIISIIIAAVMAFCLCLPAFAAQSATFAVNVVSEDNTKAVVSIDYEGGAAFNSLDFEVTISNKVSVEKVATGAGLRNFKIYAEDNYDGIYQSVLTSFNKDINPMKFSYISLVGFEAVNGKDLFVLTLKKTSSAKLTEKDVKLKVADCGISGATANEVISVNAQVIQIGGSADIKTSAAAGQAGTAVDKTNASVKTTATSAVTTTADSSELSAESTTPVAESTSDKNGENNGTKITDKKKIVIVGAAALIVLAIIVVGVVVIAKKYKKEDAE